MTTILFRNAEIYTPHDAGCPRRGSRQGELRHFARGALLAEKGLITAVGTEGEVLAALAGRAVGQEIDCQGRAVVPGFVDPHTHMCFAALREREFALRLTGVSYLEILQRGGGILSSVAAVRQAETARLVEVTRRHAHRALSMGTTTLEIKSGYGLDTASELKMLAAIGQVVAELPLDIVPTFLGAHAIPADFHDRADDYITMVIDDMLPAVLRQGIAHHCDIFCEKGVFTIEQGRRLLRAARESGLKVKLHADEVHDLGGAALAVELGALSADHLLAVGEQGIAALASAGVIATLLPATAYSLKKPFAPARRLIGEEVAVALATDCNPGSSYSESMPFVIGLAVLAMDMTPEEALTAATLNGAYALDMARQVGSLDVGKQADVAVLEGETPAILAYHAGVSPVTAVYKRGELVHSATTTTEVRKP